MDKITKYKEVLEKLNNKVIPEETIPDLKNIIEFAINIETQEVLKASCRLCFACNLAGKRKNCVVGDGPVPSDLMFVGEGPGEHEDIIGKPFVGPAGQLMNNILKAIGWDRESIYITNVVKCRPPNNETPNIEQIAHCKQFLNKEITMVKPKIIVCWGATAANTIIHPKFAISKEQGIWFEGENGIKMIAVYHPAYLLRLENIDNDKWIQAKIEVWNTIKKIDEFRRKISIDK